MADQSYSHLTGNKQFTTKFSGLCVPLASDVDLYIFIIKAAWAVGYFSAVNFAVMYCTCTLAQDVHGF